MNKVKSATAKRNAGGLANHAKNKAYADSLSMDNPNWREGGSNRSTRGSLRRDVNTHKRLVKKTSDSGNSWAGSSISSIKNLRDANRKSCGGKITRKK